MNDGGHSFEGKHHVHDEKCFYIAVSVPCQSSIPCFIRQLSIAIPIVSIAKHFDVSRANDSASDSK